MDDIKTYLERAVREDAADIFLIAGKPVSMKHGGAITTKTLDTLCFVLDCGVEDILCYKKDS